MLYGMELNAEKNLVLVADNFGYLHMYVSSFFMTIIDNRVTNCLINLHLNSTNRVDVRSNSKKGDSVLIHKKGTKVVGLHCNPVQPDLLLSCGNDHFVNFQLSCSLLFSNYVGIFNYFFGDSII